MMEKRMHTEGYTFFQMIIVMYVISILILLSIPVIGRKIDISSTDSLINDIGYCQYEAINKSEKTYYENQNIDNMVYFNRIGNSNQAQSIYYKNKRIIISLGTGRCYEKERWLCDD